MLLSDSARNGNRDKNRFIGSAMAPLTDHYEAEIVDVSRNIRAT